MKFPDSLSARVTLGWALLDHGKFEDARQELEQVLKRAPDNLAAIRGLAELHDRAENAVELPLDGPGPWPPPPDAEALKKTVDPAKAKTEDRHAPHAKHPSPPAAVPAPIVAAAAPVELDLAPLVDPVIAAEVPAPVRQAPAASHIVLDEFVPLRVEEFGEVIPNLDLTADGPEPLMLDASLLPDTTPAPMPVPADDAVLLTADDLTLGPIEDLSLLPAVVDAPAVPNAEPATVDLTAELVATEAGPLDFEPIAVLGSVVDEELPAALLAAQAFEAVETPAEVAAEVPVELAAEMPVEVAAVEAVPDDGFMLTPALALEDVADAGLTDVGLPGADDQCVMTKDEFSLAFDFETPVPKPLPPSLHVLEALLHGVAARRITAASEYHLAG